MIVRTRYTAQIQTALQRNPITAILGPRQCGKTTLARQVAAGSPEVHFFDLEDPAAYDALQTPMTTLAPLNGLVIIDEVQRSPALFPVLRVLADRMPAPVRFLILGSASPDMIRHASESLAGRVEFIDLHGFDLTETGDGEFRKLWTRGGFPRAYLAASDTDSLAWLQQFIRTFLERDIAQLGFAVPAPVLRRFWTMVAHYHGQTWNSCEIAASMGFSDQTARRYLDLLTGAYMVRQLPPWFENIGKRQRKAVKVYLRDSGLLHALLGGISDFSGVMSHPKSGASWEGFALEQALAVLGSQEAYYWAVHSGPELDLLLFRNGKRIGFEFKLADAPKLTHSMAAAVTELKLDKLYVVYPGDRCYSLAKGVDAWPVTQLSACG